MIESVDEVTSQVIGDRCSHLMGDRVRRRVQLGRLWFLKGVVDFDRAGLPPVR